MQKETKLYMTLNFFISWLSVVLLATIVLLATRVAFVLEVLAVMGLLTLLVILRIVQLIYKRLEEKKYDYQQIESLFSLYHHLQPKIKLPLMRHYAASPDFLSLIVELLEEHRPKVIVEAGSGISSMVVSEWLLQNAPDSLHFALDHEQKYADLTRKRVRNPKSTILYAPIETYTIDGVPWKYYSLKDLENVTGIDMIIVDGPPRRLQPLARYPILPLLKGKLSSRCVFVLDDANRPEEQETANRWKKEGGLRSDWHELDKGAIVLQKEG